MVFRALQLLDFALGSVNDWENTKEEYRLPGYILPEMLYCCEADLSALKQDELNSLCSGDKLKTTILLEAKPWLNLTALVLAAYLSSVQVFNQKGKLPIHIYGIIDLLIDDFSDTVLTLRGNLDESEC